MIRLAVNPKYSELREFVTNLPDKFHLIDNVEIDGRNTLKTTNINQVEISIKSFRKPFIVNRLVYTILRDSKAKRSYEHGLKLQQLGFKTPDPIGYVEKVSGMMLQQSFYVSVHEQFDGIMQEFRYGSLEDRAAIVTEFALYTAKLHEKRVLHLDYSSGNILYKKLGSSYDFYLVDLNRMKFGKEIDLAKACYSFRRLWGSNEMITLMVGTYARARGFDPDECLKKVFEYRNQFWEKFTRKYPSSRPYFADIEPD